MHASTRYAALRAAAKVTLSASVLSCGGAVSPVGALAHDGDDAATHDATVSPPDAPVALFEASVAPTACPGATSDVDATASHETYACCLSYLETQTYDAGNWDPAVDASSPSTHECCATLIGYLDHGGIGAFVDTDASAVFNMREGILESCCDGLQADGGPIIGPACTPWGPPVPPTMTFADLEIA